MALEPDDSSTRPLRGRADWGEQAPPSGKFSPPLESLFNNQMLNNLPIPLEKSG